MQGVEYFLNKENKHYILHYYRDLHHEGSGPYRVWTLKRENGRKYDLYVTFGFYFQKGSPI